MENAPKLNSFMRLVKVDEAKRQAWGIATAEVVDKSGEICDYEGAKKAYQDWSKEAKDATSRSGQEISLGNVRLQHTIQPVGKVIELDFQDENKQIYVGTYISDDQTWSDIQKGILTGFSHGGEYDWRQCNECKCDMIGMGQYCPKCKKTVETRYAPILAELSVVDNPCLGKAHFDYIKADGSRESRPFPERSTMDKTSGATAETPPNPTLFDLEALKTTIKTVAEDAAALAVQKAKEKEKKTKRVAGEDLTSDAFLIVGDPEKTETWKLPVKFSDEKKTKSHIRNAIARFDQLKDVSEEDKVKAWKKLVSLAEKYDIKVEAEQEKAAKFLELAKAKLEKTLEAKGLEKGMYQIAQFADVLSSLSYLRDCALAEGAWEEDERDIEIAGDLDELIESAIEIFLTHAEEETSELIRNNKAAKAEKGNNMETLDLLKAAKKTLGAHYATKAAHHTKKAEIASKKSDLHKAAAEAEDVAEGQKKFHKGMASECDKESKAHEKMAAHYTKMADSYKEDKDGDGDIDKAVAAESELQKSITESLTAKPETAAPADAPAPAVEKSAPVVKTVAEAEALIEQMKAEKMVADFKKSLEAPEPMRGSVVNPELTKSTPVPRGGETMTVSIGSTLDCGL